MLLTGVSFILGEHRASALFILCAAGVKFSLVAWCFMDLRKVAFIWSAGLFVLVGAILALGLFV